MSEKKGCCTKKEAPKEETKEKKGCGCGTKK